jgi:hypothetical protein
MPSRRGQWFLCHSASVRLAKEFFAGEYRESGNSQTTLVAFQSTADLSPAIIFPFYEADGTHSYCRIKPDGWIEIGGKRAKYLSPKGKPNQVYIPPDVASRWLAQKA